MLNGVSGAPRRVVDSGTNPAHIWHRYRPDPEWSWLQAGSMPSTTGVYPSLGGHTRQFNIFSFIFANLLRLSDFWTEV